MSKLYHVYKLYTKYPIVTGALGLAAECAREQSYLAYKYTRYSIVAHASKGSSIKDVRTRGMANSDACVNFACKRPNFADILYGWPLSAKDILCNCTV